MGVGGCNAEQFFILSVLTSYYRWEAIVFWEFDAVWSKKSTLSREFWRFFLRNNVFTQENRTVKKHQPQKKFIFWQLVSNFFDFWQNNSIFLQKVGGGLEGRIFKARPEVKIKKCIRGPSGLLSPTLALLLIPFLNFLPQFFLHYAVLILTP